MANSNYVTKVAIVGASGNSGKFMTEALLSTGKHIVTALTRLDSQACFPDGVAVRKVDYSNVEALTEALRGQDALVITLGGHTPPDVQTNLVKAAGEAGVPWVLPNEWSPDTEHEPTLKDVFIFKAKKDFRDAFSTLSKGNSSYVAITTGFWYEWSLAIGPAFGIDLDKRTVTFFDEGETKISTSTWPQVGRAVAALLSLPIQRDELGKGACLNDFRNKMVYMNSFTVSQKDMLESALRVTGTALEDWSITKEPSHERYATGIREMGEGSRIGFAKMMYTRVFYPDGSGDFEHGKGTINGILGLPKEDLDEATKRALERSKVPTGVLAE